MIRSDAYPVSPEDMDAHEQRCALLRARDEERDDEDLRGEPERWDGEP